MTLSAQLAKRSRRILPSRKTCWFVIDAGSRLVKCGLYSVTGGQLNPEGARIVDIQEEGLLSGEEVAGAVADTLDRAEAFPVALVLPQSVAISQVIDLEAGGDEAEGERLKQGVRALIGLAEGRFVHDSCPLKPKPGQNSPYWVTVAREEVLAKYLAPWLARGVRIESITTSGNALWAAFKEAHPLVEQACLVEFGATQTTLVQAEAGQPEHMGSFPHGGEALTEAIVGLGGAGFDEQEQRMLQQNLFKDGECGPPLRRALDEWLGRLQRQLNEWDEEGGLKRAAARREVTHAYLYGGYASIKGLIEYLNERADGFHFVVGAKNKEASLMAVSHGAAILAAGKTAHRASLLPNSLAGAAKRRVKASRLNQFSLVFLALTVLVLSVGILQQASRVGELDNISSRVQSVLQEGEQVADILRQRDAIAQQIAPMVDRQVASIEAVETFRMIQEVSQEIEFTLLRFADRRSYFRGVDRPGQRRTTVEPAEEAQAYEADTVMGLHGFVVDLMLEGDPAEQLDRLGEIVLRLREEAFFANVDRLMQRPANGDFANGSALSGETYALMLTLSERQSRSSSGDGRRSRAGLEAMRNSGNE